LDANPGKCCPGAHFKHEAEVRGFSRLKLKTKWPKQLPPLTEDQLRIKDDFMKYWHEVLPKRYGVVERFNHGYPLPHSASRQRILEIGSGLGEHIRYEELKNLEYYAVENRPELAARIKRRFPDVKVLVADCQRRLDLPDGFFHRILAIHVLEHLPDLPAALAEVWRLLDPGGEFRVVIPCEGGIAYSLARRISARRIFERRYHTSYDWFIETEHINRPHEIMEELEGFFTVRHRAYFPFRVPSIALNLVIGLTLTPKAPETRVAMNS
jgi:SAM-dependent methyltransferase